MNEQIEKNEKLDVVENEVKKAIEANLDMLYSDIRPDLDLSSINIDSMSFIKICASLETTFNFIFDDEMLAISSFKTLEDFISYVKSRAQI
ncbi:phosphopantetheine-binding protein [Clostridium sp. BNL1100]|uniref:phosphopantetheine-binding protein n=1 Tax=Clostridium sp. BNL1100 TaxID=755731 RepID=UPI00024A7656|nr:phosphopantetheine-binding protein [Clostridium sp. BNL1100]AEY67780.1 phosphopantetheine-containing protein [Clostridium sp. BNL1100]